MSWLGWTTRSKSLGDPELDAVLRLQAFTPDDRQRLEEPVIRRALLRLLRVAGFSFAEGQLSLDVRGTLYEGRRRRLLTAVAQFARALNTVEAARAPVSASAGS